MADFVADEDFTPDSTRAPAASAPSAGAPSFVPDSHFEADDENIGRQALTALEQGVSGATLGLSKKAETTPAYLPGPLKAALVAYNAMKGNPLDQPITTPEEIKKREEDFPVTATAANILGTIGSVAATGGAGALTKGAGLAAKAAAYGAEGSLIAGVNQATDDWSQDKALDAGKIAASAGLGFFLGAGGVGLTAGLGKVASKLADAVSWLNQYMEKAASGEGYAANMAKAYQAAGSKTGEIVSDLADHFNDLYRSAKQAASDMYEKAGAFHLGNALEDMPIERAKLNAQQTIDKIKELSVPGEGEILGLSPTSSKILTSNLQDLSSEVSDAKSSYQVHTALRKAATAIDQGIKFDKIPTGANQIDQGILQNVRSAIRGDLKDPELWGEKASNTYGELSENYSHYQNSVKQFQKDFMKPRVGSDGKTIRVADPGKINSFFKDPSAPAQQLKAQTLDQFLSSAKNNAQYAENFEGFQSTMDDLSKQIEALHSDVLEKQAKLGLLKAVADAKKGHGAGIGTLALLETLPIPGPLKAAFLAAKRYLGTGGGQSMGGDLYQGVQLAKGLADHVEKTTDLLGNKARLIFSGSSSQARKVSGARHE